MRNAGRVLRWALLIGATERAWRWTSRSRARAWQLTAVTLIAAATRPTRRLRRRDIPPRSAWTLLLGVALVVGGYPLGRALLGDRPTTPPRDNWAADLTGLCLLAVAEELTWRARVETALGIGPTAGLFAIKHVLMDGRWRRVVGLALFWIGLGLVGRHSARAALWLHVAANAGGVLLGHARARDQF